MTDESSPVRGRGMAIRGPQDFVSGLMVLILASIFLWALSRVATTQFESISPTIFPRICAYGLGLLGLLLALRGLLRDGPKIGAWPLRGMTMITLAAIAFGALTNVIGFLAAGFLAVVFAGLASTESRLRELVLLAAGLVLLSYLLFSVGLNLSLLVFRIPGQPS